jgi:hypothetical protein
VPLSLEKIPGYRPAPGPSDAAPRLERPQGASSGTRDPFVQNPTSLASAAARAADGRSGRPGPRSAPDKRRLDDRIDNALRIVAALLEHDEAYLPIFLRLEAERDRAAARNAALDRARDFYLRPRS